MTAKNTSTLQPIRDFWICTLFLVAVFAMGGGARPDVLSLVVLRPLAVAFLVTGLIMFPRDGWAEQRAAFNLLAAAALIVSIHLIPLPPALWTALPGRELIESIDRAAELGSVWRPLTISPPDGWNALFSFVVPFAALVLAAGTRTESHVRLLFIFVAIGVASVLLGIMQLQGTPNGPLYFYRITNQGALVGLFSNRNHHAMFLATLLPMLGYLAGRDVADTRSRVLQLALCVGGALFFLAALAVNGSRGGFALGVFGFVLATVLFREPIVKGRTHRDRTDRKGATGKLVSLRWRLGAAAVVVAFGVGLFAFPSSQTMSRVLQTDVADESRLGIWHLVPDLAWQYFPLGSGAGSFVEAYKIAERRGDLGFNYVNHAHNDWLEVFLTFGLPGLLLLSGAVAAWVVAARGLLTSFQRDSESVRLGQLGAAVTAMLAMGSVVDYPLRTPSIACLFIFAVVWMGRGFTHSKISLGNISR